MKQSRRGFLIQLPERVSASLSPADLSSLGSATHVRAVIERLPDGVGKLTVSRGNKQFTVTAVDFGPDWVHQIGDWVGVDLAAGTASPLVEYQNESGSLLRIAPNVDAERARVLGRWSL